MHKTIFVFHFSVKREKHELNMKHLNSRNPFPSGANDATAHVVFLVQDESVKQNNRMPTRNTKSDAPSAPLDAVVPTVSVAFGVLPNGVKVASNVLHPSPEADPPRKSAFQSVLPVGSATDADTWPASAPRVTSRTVYSVPAVTASALPDESSALNPSPTHPGTTPHGAGEPAGQCTEGPQSPVTSDE